MSALVSYRGAHWLLIWMCLPDCLLRYMSHCTPLGCVQVQQHIQEQVFGLSMCCVALIMGCYFLTSWEDNTRQKVCQSSTFSIFSVTLTSADTFCPSLVRAVTVTTAG